MHFLNIETATVTVPLFLLLRWAWIVSVCKTAAAAQLQHHLLAPKENKELIMMNSQILKNAKDSNVSASFIIYFS